MSATVNEAIPATGLWEIVPDYSLVTYAVRHHGTATFRGAFTNITGSFDGDAGRVTGEVALTEMLTGLERLKRQFLTPEWFDAEDFPTMRFVSTAIREAGSGVVVEGELTVHGVTKPIIATGTWQHPQQVLHSTGKTTERMGLDLTATIDRRDYGLTFNSEVAEGVLNLGWNVKLEATIQLIRSAA